MNKMRGAIDPYTLGFLISLIAGSVTYFAQVNHQTEITSKSVTNVAPEMNINQADHDTQTVE